MAPSRRSGAGKGFTAYPRGVTVNAQRVNQLLSLRGKVKRAPRPIVLPDETALRLELNRQILSPPR